MTHHAESAVRACQCGFDISLYSAHLKICYGCRIARLSPRKCIDCGDEFRSPKAERCEDCQRVNYLYRNFGTGRYLAGMEVCKARATGALPSAKGFRCADCDRQASEYDHRDYSKPLTVEPVCRRCNSRRGHAQPKDWSFDEFWSWLESSKLSTFYTSGIRDFERRIELMQRRHWPGNASPVTNRSSARHTEPSSLQG
jgi:hypothetical protein